ncbi:TldE-like protein [Candidatus Woesearchaeota archaeon]|nr:TldE-like protein [Candidatus Woesearchaeota archaeon]|tara:strand:- start:4407 stop:5741 length:1335 start_codon:yes stop_codon:yes gene_type:complete
MEPEELTRYIQEQLLKKGTDSAIVSLQKQESSQIKFSNSKVSAIKNWYQMAIGVYAVYKKRTIMISTRDFSKESADEVVDKLLKFAKNLPPNKEYNGIAKGPFKYRNVKKGFDKRVKELNKGENIEVVKQAVDAAVKKGAKRVAGVLETDLSSVYLITSNNVIAREKSTSLYFSLRALVDKYASCHLNYGARTMDGFEPEKIGRKAASLAKKAVNPVEGRSGKFDVLFSPLAFANILANLGEAFSVFSVESGLSCLAGKLNKMIASPIVNIYDDGTVANALGSSGFDAEGVPSKKTAVIENGELKTYLHNSSTAKRHHTETTANAGLVSPEPSNIVLEKGDSSEEDMLKEIKEGYYITNLWYTRFNNYNTGDFSTIPRDAVFYVKDGEIKFPVKHLRISDNILNILKNVKMIGNRPEQIFGWEIETPVITPMVLVKGLNITKSE